MFALFFALVSLFPSDDTLDQKLARFRADDTKAYEELVAAGESAVDGLVAIVQDAKLVSRTRFMAANALGEIGSKRAVEPLLGAITDSDFNLRRCAALALGKLKDPRAKKPLEELAEKDPYVYHDPKSNKDLYLVRDDAKRALEILAGRADTGGLVLEPEIFLADASKLPPSPVKVKITRLPFPFPGDFKAQNIFNNYEQPTDIYIHAGLDILHPAGTEVHAVDSGWVAFVSTNYPEWKTHHFFVVTPEKGANEGWCYTHLDPDSFTFKVGDKVQRGAVLGKLVDFYVGANKGMDHVHLHYVRFKQKPEGTYDIDSLVDPLAFFDWDDTEKPVIQDNFHFVHAGTLDEFAAGKDGLATVSGEVDVIAGISDLAYSGQGCNWMVPVVTLEITSERAKPWRKLVLDQRGEIGDETASSALYVKYDDKQRWLKDLPPFPVIQLLIATHTDGDGRLERADALQHWKTAERDEHGERRFPDGAYQVTVRAWDLKGNPAARTVRVRVENR